MVSTLSWTTFAIPSSMVNVGNEAVCLLCDNILCFSDLKTKNISYYKAESPQLGLSICAMTGHNRFALVAFSEVVLKPSVHIIQYPNFSKYAVFTTQNMITFVDIRFNEYDLLLALSGQPHYTMCIWNFRTGQLLLQQDTMKASLQHSLLCSDHHTPQIIQFSAWKRELLAWELCYTATGVDLHEVSKIRLSKKFTLSSIFSMSFNEDNNLYAVDNYGTVSLVEVAHFNLKSQWSIVEPNEIRSNFRYFKIESHRQGLIVYCKDILYYLRKKQNHWYCELKILNDQMPEGGLLKCISNINGEVYASAAIGNLYHLELQVDKECYIIPFNIRHENSIDFAVLKGIKEECVILLTTKGCLKAFEMSYYLLYSSLEIPFANSIVAHNMGPYIMVGTSTGQLHFLNYSNIREPVELGSIETEKHYPICSVELMDQLSVYRSIYNHFYLVKTDFANAHFSEISEIVRLDEKIGMCQFFLAEDNYIFIFVNRNSEILLPHADELWSFKWLQEENIIKRQYYELPFTYRDIGFVTVSSKNVTEFYAVRLESNIIDCLQLKNDTYQLVLTHRIQTAHLSNINGIVGSRNLLTWGVDGTYVHFRTHKKSTKTYGICQILQIKYRPRVVQRVLDCFNAKYLVYMYSLGGIKVMKAATAGIPTIENYFIIEDNFSSFLIEPSTTSTIRLGSKNVEVVIEHSEKELQARDKLSKRVQELEAEVTGLINYDMSVTGKSQGIFRKFCLNYKWLEKLIEESQHLCEVERRSLEAAVSDQSRIRDWLYFLIMSTNSGISFRIRAIFSNFSLENYCLRKRNDKFAELFEFYRFYDMEADEDEEIEEDMEQESKKDVVVKKLNYFKVHSSTAYEHIMSDALAMQDINIVTGNQMHNQDAKFRILLSDRLKCDFNKKFEEIRQIKFELMEAILTTNNTLSRIYDNMNCMLRLLGQPEFRPPQPSVPEWQKDEFVKSIMEVDDSEIKAVNRRKKKDEVQVVKRGRLLLWAVDFWVRALITMMDGVLEKLWEEEIKKNVPIPEFMIKKEPAEYTLEDQKALREYEEKCRILEQDRKKYLKILAENEVKTNEMKTNYILKLNENITEMMILKLKYDFAIKHVRLRNLNSKVMYFKKLQWLSRIDNLRADIDLIQEYIQKYAKLSEFWSKSVEDLRLKVETLQVKDKSIERQFKGQFLNTIPQHLGPEMIKLFKKRPKTSPKLLNSTLICKELALRVNSRSQPKFSFPLPKEVYEYLDTLNALDDPSSMPVSLESKHWDHFIKLRRQKVEIELKERAVNLQLNDSTSDMNTYVKELANLKNTKADALLNLQEAHDEYLKSVQNQTLELRLTMGQVEFNIMGSLNNLHTCMLMHEDDINDINALILKAGQMKLKAMQRVAFFRRQVIFKEWEHKVVSANIEYLKHLLYIIEKCKVSIEFLNILRNWKKVKAEKQKMLTTEGLLEKVSEEKLYSSRKQIVRLNEKIAKVRQQIDEMKKSNKRINRQIEDLKVSVAFATTNRDLMVEDKKRREQNERMEKIKKHSNLLETVRRDYVQLMELKTILELQRLRTYPTLGPNPSHCLF